MKDLWSESQESNIKMLNFWLWRWRKGPLAKEHENILEAGKGKETDSLVELQEGNSPTGSLTWAQWTDFGLTKELHNSKFVLF